MIVAVGMLRDEEDIIVPIVAQLFAQGVDRVIVADNLSTDSTRALLEDLARVYPLTIIDDPEPGYYQAEKTTRLAHLAAAGGATWVLPFDADEYWYGLGGTIADRLNSTGADVVKAYGYDHVPRAEYERGERNPVRRLTWRRATTQTFPKVAFRPHPDVFVHMGNHNVDRPGPVAHDVLEYRHFGYRTPAQMTRKVRNGKAAYEASTVHEMHGAHWRRLGALTDDELAAEWQALLDEEGLIYDPAPTGLTMPRETSRPGVTVVIPHYGRAELTAACLLALAENTPPGVEVIVVDNGTGERFTCDQQISNPENLGFARACNQGAAAATHPRIIFLNNDTQVRAGWLPPLLRALDEPGVAAAGALLVYPDGGVQHAGIRIDDQGGKVTAWNETQNLARRDVDGVTGACLAVNRAPFEEVGRFDERFWNGYEDVSLCLTLRAVGWRILFEPDSVVTHHESASGSERWARTRQNIALLQELWAPIVNRGGAN